MFRDAELSSMEALHNALTMSSMTTPTRLGRGLMIPGIDTRHPLEKTTTALSYGGLHTPPQSAHESRRPSLQYSTLSEAPYSAVSGPFNYSQPSTPIHTVDHNGASFMQSWPEASVMQTNAMSSLPSSSPHTQLAGHFSQAAFDVHSGCTNAMMDTTPRYSQQTLAHGSGGYEPHDGSSLSPAETWKPSADMVNGYVTQNTCLGTALFPVSRALSQVGNGSMSTFDGLGSSLQELHPEFETSSVGDLHGYNLPASYIQPPQVVVPSQLSPHDDYLHQQVSYYTSPDRHRDGLNSSFGSSSTAFDEYEMIRPASPIDAYFAHSEDEEYLTVKSEDISSPITGPSSNRLVEANGMPMRKKRHSPRRLRKAGRSAPCHVHDVRGCLVQCEGAQCYLQPLKYERASNKKPHKCDLCTAAFDRSEHLKRHRGKHQTQEDRKYPCPLCEKRIGRPDNAGDHFKTHLRPKTKGKRNDHFEWPVLRDAILDNYEYKTAKKLTDGLYRWIQLEKPETSGSRQAR